MVALVHGREFGIRVIALSENLELFQTAIPEPVDPTMLQGDEDPHCQIGKFLDLISYAFISIPGQL